MFVSVWVLLCLAGPVYHNRSLFLHAHRSTPTRVPRSLFAKTATADAQTDDNTVTDTNESADDSTITQSTTIQQTPTRIPPPPARFLLAPASPAQPRDYYTAGTTYSAGTTAGSARIEVWWGLGMMGGMCWVCFVYVCCHCRHHICLYTNTHHKTQVVTPNNFFHAMPTMAAQEQPTNTIDSTHTTLDLPTNEAPINEAPTNEAPALLQGDQSLGVDHQLLMDTQSSESDWLTTMSAGVVVDKEEETAVVEDNVMIMEDNTFMGELDTIIEENTVMGELDAIIADNTIIEDNTTQQPKNSPVVVGFDISNTTLMANNPATLLPALPLSPVPESMEVTRHGGRSLAAMGNAVGDAATPVLISKDLQQMSEQGVEDLPVLMQLTDGNWTTPSVSNTSITSDIFVMDDLGTPLQALVQAVSKM